MSGDPFQCSGVGSASVETVSGQRAVVDVLVVHERPMGVEMVLGITGISALGGVSVESPSKVRFCGAVCQPCPVVEAPDFTARFDPVERSWTVAWKWADGSGPECLANSVSEYAVSAGARKEFDTELQSWIDSGWLVPYSEELYGPPRGLIPLMAVVQNNKAKVRPVLDFRELNSHVTAHTADADVCAEELRKWRRHGANIAVVDLKRAYLQLRTDRRLWPFQTVLIRGRRYALTRVGFGLSVAPLIMKAVVRAVLAQDPVVERAVLPFVDDLCVNENVASAEQVVAHFASYGLQCKEPERAAGGARLLGLHVQSDGSTGELQWRRDNAVGAPPSTLTRRAVFSWCGRLVAHLPVCGWLRPAAAWLKRRVNAVTRGWDDVTADAALRDQVNYVTHRLEREDPAHGQWCVSGDHVVVWTDASSVASGVVLVSPDGQIIEDASWLRRDETSHINMAELDAAVRGINMAIAWGMKTVDLRTDSSAVHRWISDALSGRARLRTKAHGEMLIRRRVDVIKQLVNEFHITLSVRLVRSAENVADCLTRVPSQWVQGHASAVCAAVLASDDSSGECVPTSAASETLETGSVASVAADDSRAHADVTDDAIVEVHARAGHPGIRRTLYFARRDVSRDVTRDQVRAVVSRCDVCRSVDPAPVKWAHGSLSVPETWWRLALDITHYCNQAFLTVIDCGPARFSLWLPLRRSDAASVVAELEKVFFERGAPVEVLMDNGTAFRSRQFAVFAAQWGVRLRFRAVHRPSGCGIIERNHRTVKVIASRKRCAVPEAVHIYNVTPRDGDDVSDTPASGVYRYTVRDCVRAASVEPASPVMEEVPSSTEYSVGDTVWVRRPGTRCTDKSRRDTVTGVVSPEVIEVGGVPWHVRDLRLCATQPPSEPGIDPVNAGEVDSAIADNADVELGAAAGDAGNVDDNGLHQAESRAQLRRSERSRRPPDKYGYE